MQTTYSTGIDKLIIRELLSHQHPVDGMILMDKIEVTEGRHGLKIQRKLDSSIPDEVQVLDTVTRNDDWMNDDHTK